MTCSHTRIRGIRLGRELTFQVTMRTGPLFQMRELAGRRCSGRQDRPAMRRQAHRLPTVDPAVACQHLGATGSMHSDLLVTEIEPDHKGVVAHALRNTICSSAHAAPACVPV